MEPFSRRRYETSFGLISVVAGGLGGLLTSAEAARTLAATSGIAGGSGAVINKSLLKDQSIKIIYSGIDMKRAELAGEFAPNRAKPLAEYSLNLAIKDAVRYTDACNIVEALSKVSDTVAIESVKPGVGDGAKIGAGSSQSASGATPNDESQSPTQQVQTPKQQQKRSSRRLPPPPLPPPPSAVLPPPSAVVPPASALPQSFFQTPQVESLLDSVNRKAGSANR